MKTELLWTLLVATANAWLLQGPHCRHRLPRTLLLAEASTQDEESSLATTLWQPATAATVPRAAKTADGAHDEFRYEWGTWVNETSLEALMTNIDRVRLHPGSLDRLEAHTRYRVAGAENWECFLHILPSEVEWKGRWHTGSWAIVKALTGVAQVAQLRGPNAQGIYKPTTQKNLRGGGDGTLGGGSASLGGDKCIKYVGGPLRSYTGKGGKTVLLEVVVLPPVRAEDDVGEFETLPVPVEDILFLQAEEEEAIVDEVNGDVEDSAYEAGPSAQPTIQSKIGLEFDQVGGLDAQLNDIARRVLVSRANPAAARRLGISHVRGILLSGPPGCGKTLLARELARLLGAREPQIVNGPEILDKFIGEAEKKVRELFLPAELEYKQVGDKSALHIIILDEMDAIARKRGTMTSDTTGVRDSVVNQLLAKMDGVQQANNILVVGLTNRPELLDPALLRPGRLEVQLRVELPDRKGRRDILRIHTRQMKDAGALAEDARMWIEDLTENGLPGKTEHFSGAELAGLVRSAASYALARSTLDDLEGSISADDLRQALTEVRPALGKDNDALHQRYPLGVSAFSPEMAAVQSKLHRFTDQTPGMQSLLLVGSGASALASWAAATGSSDNVRLVTMLDLMGTEGGMASALVDLFHEATDSVSSTTLVLDDIDLICENDSAMRATLRALLRTPQTKSIRILGTASKLSHDLQATFDETHEVPLVKDRSQVEQLLRDSRLELDDELISSLASTCPAGCKDLLRAAELAVRDDPRRAQALEVERSFDRAR